MKHGKFIKIFDICFKFVLLVVITCCCIAMFSSCDKKAYYREVDNLDDECVKKVKVEGHDYIIFQNKVGKSLGFSHSGNCPCNPYRNDTIR